nr:hypothetical protein [Pantoea agglomerans]
MQVVAEPVSAEQQDKTLNDLLASRSANQVPTFNLGFALFNDPYTNWDARTFCPLLDMTTDNTQASMDGFAGALHQVLAEGQEGQNQYDNSDTSEAMAITFADAIRSTPNPGNKAQLSINDALKQLEVYRQQWQTFADKYIA